MTTNPGIQPPATPAPAEISSANASGAAWAIPLINAMVVLGSAITLVLIVSLALAKSITIEGGEIIGASEAVSIVTSSGAILTGLIGTYFGVNVAHKAQNVAESAQGVAQSATQQSVGATALAAAATARTLDPDDPLRERLERHFFPS